MSELADRLRHNAEQVSHALIWHTLAPLLTEAADRIDELEQNQPIEGCDQTDDLGRPCILNRGHFGDTHRYQ